MLTPDQIRNKRFEKGFSGYRSDEVDEFLDKLCTDFELLLQERDSLEHKLETVAEKLEEYRNDEETMRAAILNAQKLGDSILKNAREKAQEVTEQAQLQADAAIQGIAARIEKEQALLDALKAEVSGFKETLMNTYRKHLELISELPEHHTQPEEKQVPEQSPPPEAPPEPEILHEETPTEQAQQEAVQEQAQLFEEPQAQEELPPAAPRIIKLERAPQPEPIALGRTMELDMPDEDDIVSMDIVSPSALPVKETGKSKFGPLKFGDDFNFDEEDPEPDGKASRGSLFSRRKR